MRRHGLGIMIVALAVGGCISRDLYVYEDPSAGGAPDRSHADVPWGMSMTCQISLGGYPQSMVAHDLNGDQLLDLALIVCETKNEQWSNCTVLTLLGNGTGQFQTPMEVPIDPDRTYRNLLACDFDGDFVDDLLAEVNIPGREGVAYGVAFWKGNGDGAFAPPVDPLATQPISLAHQAMEGFYWKTAIVSGRFGAESPLQVLVTQNQTWKLLMIRHNSVGFETVDIDWDGTCGVVGSKVADLNADGFDDILSRPNCLYLSDGAYGFQKHTIPNPVYPQGFVPRRAILDINADGYADLFHFLCDDKDWYLKPFYAMSYGGADGAFGEFGIQSYIETDTKACPNWFIAADLDNSGKNDLLALDDDMGMWPVIIGEQDEAQGVTAYPTGSPVAVAGDFDMTHEGTEVVFAHDWEIYCVTGESLVDASQSGATQP